MINYKKECTLSYNNSHIVFIVWNNTILYETYDNYICHNLRIFTIAVWQLAFFLFYSSLQYIYICIDISYVFSL